MVRVWCDTVRDTGISTDGKYASVDANKSEIKVNDEEARSMLGLIVGSCPTGITDAERVSPAIRLNSKPLGISNVEIPLPDLGILDPDSLSNYFPIDSIFLPYRFTQKARTESIFNKGITVEAKNIQSITKGLDIAVGLVFSDAEWGSEEYNFLREEFKKAYNGARPPFTDSNFSNDAGFDISTNTLSVIEQPSGMNLITGHNVSVYPVGVTADDPISGTYEISADNINLGSQLYPLSTFYAPVLGTVTETRPRVGKHVYNPARFSISQDINITYTPSVNALVDAGTNPDVISSVLADMV